MLIENSAEEELFSGCLSGLEIPTSLESVAGIASAAGVTGVAGMAGNAGVREDSRSARPLPGSLRRTRENAPVLNSVAPQPSLARRIFAFVLEAVIGLTEGGRMVRRIGPGMKPEERYEFENPRYTEWRL